MITKNEIMEYLHCSKATAYKILKELKQELEKQGYKTIKGLVPEWFFKERYGIERRENK
jgi:transcriptional antiterminator